MAHQRRSWPGLNRPGESGDSRTHLRCAAGAQDATVRWRLPVVLALLLLGELAVVLLGAAVGGMPIIGGETLRGASTAVGGPEGKDDRGYGAERGHRVQDFPPVVSDPP